MCRTSGCAACACGELDCVTCAVCEAEADGLTGPNAGYLARRWFEQGKVDWSDGTDLVQLHERPNVRGDEAFWRAYLRDLANDGRDLWP
jgi:hypothetical protein